MKYRAASLVKLFQPICMEKKGKLYKSPDIHFKTPKISVETKKLHSIWQRRGMLDFVSDIFLLNFVPFIKHFQQEIPRF